MSGMMFGKRNRAHIDSRSGCDCCNANLTKGNVKREKRRMKRRERASWRREVTA